MDLIERIARIYAKYDGHDPDGDHFVPVFSVTGEPEEKKTGQKKWELYKGRAEAAIEIFKILKEEGK